MRLRDLKLCLLSVIAVVLAIIIAPAVLAADPATPKPAPAGASPAPAAASPNTASPAPATGSVDRPPLKKEELEQLLAPIALYPDSLLTQMLMASTYPLEIVQADRWAKEHKDLKGDALATELEKLDWDPSVKSLVNFPDQLTMMNDKLDLTIKIGDAFLEQQKDVLNTVQVLRNKAQANGNLQSNDQQKVDVQAAPTTATASNTTVVNVQSGGDSSQTTPTIVQAPPQVITIESPTPQTVYVPSYNPTVVYGSWPYPAYPPAPYYPPGYVASAALSFGVGVACGAAWGYAWGNCNWGGGDVDIDVNRNANFNTNIDRSKAQANINNRQTNRQTNRQGGAGQNGRSSWQHDPSHRKGAAYRDQRTSQKFGGANASAQATQAREQYRGRADAGRQDLNRGGANQLQSAGGANRAGAGNASQNRAAAGGAAQNRAGSPSQNRASPNSANRSSPSAANRSTSGTRGGAFEGTSRGSSGARADSQRGQASRGSSRSGPSRSGGGGSRSGGGGGSRGGGGRGGGGRR